MSIREESQVCHSQSVLIFFSFLIFLKQEVPEQRQGAVLGVQEDRKKSRNASKINSVWSTLDNTSVLAFKTKQNCTNKALFIYIY